MTEQKITVGKKVSIIYSITNSKNEIIMEVLPLSPFVYLHGCKNENIVPGLEESLTGAKEGEELIISLPADLAYGNYDKKLVIEVKKEELANMVEEIWVGAYIERFLRDNVDNVSEFERLIKDIEEENEPEGFIVREIRKDTVVLDGNHPYAGMDLIFNVKVLSITDASAMELENGYPKEYDEYYNKEDDFYGV